MSSGGLGWGWVLGADPGTTCQLVYSVFASWDRGWQKVKSKASIHSSEEWKDRLALERKGLTILLAG